jgi:hypothetical protein
MLGHTTDANHYCRQLTLHHYRLDIIWDALTTVQMAVVASIPTRTAGAGTMLSPGHATPASAQ